MFCWCTELHWILNVKPILCSYNKTIWSWLLFFPYWWFWFWLFVCLELLCLHSWDIVVCILLFCDVLIYFGEIIPGSLNKSGNVHYFSSDIIFVRLVIFLPSWTRRCLKYIYKFLMFLKIYLFYFLAVVGPCCCMRAFSSCCDQEILFVWCTGFSLWWLLLLQSTGSRVLGRLQ